MPLWRPLRPRDSSFGNLNVPGFRDAVFGQTFVGTKATIPRLHHSSPAPPTSLRIAYFSPGSWPELQIPEDLGAPVQSPGSSLSLCEAKLRPRCPLGNVVLR